MVLLMVILFSTKCFLFVYMDIDLKNKNNNDKAYKLFENSDADLSCLLFKEANLFPSVPTWAVVILWCLLLSDGFRLLGFYEWKLKGFESIKMSF